MSIPALSTPWPGTKWYYYHDNLVAVGSLMVEEGISAEDLLYFFEKPWKYEDKWNEYVEAERAMEEDHG